jgi:hypothetical protein
MFYFGFFFVVVMVLLNIFLAIVVGAYETVHSDVVSHLDHGDANVRRCLKLPIVV